MASSAAPVFLEGRCSPGPSVPCHRREGASGKSTALSHSIDGILSLVKSIPASSTAPFVESHPSDQRPSQTPVRTPSAVSDKRGTGSRRRRARTNYTPEQLSGLEALFLNNQYPGIDEREALADAVDLSEARVQVWFQNRRARLRRKHRNSLGSASSTESVSPKAPQAPAMEASSPEALRSKPDIKQSRPPTPSSPQHSHSSTSILSPSTSEASRPSSSPLQYLQVCTQACCVAPPTVPHTQHLIQSGSQYLTSASCSYYPWMTLSSYQSGHHPYSYVYPGAHPAFYYDYTFPLPAPLLTSVNNMPETGLSSSVAEASSSVCM